MSKQTTFYGIWCFDESNNKSRLRQLRGDWLREHGEQAVLAYEDKDLAEQRAARNYYFHTYEEAKDNGWCEVRPIS